VGALALLLLDLDRFKLVNDSLGLLTGDLVLAAAAHRLRDATLPTERLGRLGGDEIVLLLEAETPEGFRQRANQVMAVFDEPFLLGDRECALTASGGLAVAYPGAGPEELLSQADAAMFRAKDLGRDRVETYDRALADLLSRRFRLESALRQAVRNGDLELHYQPELHLPTRSIHGVEALVRWNHPDEGLLSAAEFVPIAEDSGLIVELGRWVFAEACRQLAEWQAAGRWPLMRVNVSAKQLNHPDVVDDLVAMIEASGADPGFLCLELTETAVMADADLSLEVLGKLAGLGLQLAIDDFGTGYSSLSYLKRLSMHVLKIDRSFVDGLGRSSDDVAIVAAIISLAQTLGLTVTAEGIESKAQLRVLMELGCEYGQGWLFAKAMPATEVTALLDAAAPFD
jgi:diguanylate cyclase (GGDEF)-like protein